LPISFILKPEIHPGKLFYVICQLILIMLSVYGADNKLGLFYKICFSITSTTGKTQAVVSLYERNI